MKSQQDRERDCRRKLAFRECTKLYKALERFRQASIGLPATVKELDHLNDMVYDFQRKLAELNQRMERESMS